MNNKIIYLFVSIFLIGFIYYLYLQKNEEKYKVVVLWTGAGEHEWAKRLEIIFNNLKWESKIACSPQNALSSSEASFFGQFVSPFTANQIVQEFQPDFVISLSHRCQKISSNAKSYLALAGDNKKIFDATYSKQQELLTFDGLLYASPHIERIKQNIESHGKTFHGINWYPSCPATPYQPTVPKRLFYCGFQWDQKRNGLEYQKMFSLLDKQGYLDVYGPPEKWDYLKNGKRGYVAFDGKSLSEAIRKAGITLILHADNHVDVEAPTSRIFEAAAACSVIISDKHPFIMREFGDSVLYIDGNLDGEQLFDQIDQHVNWIDSNPEEAQKLARRAHAIFLEKFTLERQVENLIKLHKKILKLH